MSRALNRFELFIILIGRVYSSVVLPRTRGGPRYCGGLLGKTSPA